MLFGASVPIDPFPLGDDEKMTLKELKKSFSMLIMAHWFIADLDSLIHATGEELAMMQALLHAEDRMNDTIMKRVTVLEQDYAAAVNQYNRALDYKQTLLTLHKIRREIYSISVKEDLMVIDAAVMSSINEMTVRPMAGGR